MLHYILSTVLLLLTLQSHAQKQAKKNLLKGYLPSATVITKAHQEFIDGHATQLKEFEVPSTLGMIEIPVKVHIVQGEKKADNTNVLSVKEAFNQLNKYFMTNYTRFIPLNDFNYIAAPEFYSLTKENEEKLCEKNDVKNVLNLYIVGEILVENKRYCGYTYLPTEDQKKKTKKRQKQIDRMFLSSSCLSNGVSLARHMGNYLTLYPTHGLPDQGEGEFVIGSNCATQGDKICDTPADPGLTMDMIDEYCGYLGKVQDKSGRKRYYKPATRNLMSDNPRLYCCNQFSPEQYKRMLYATMNLRNYLQFPSRGYSKRQLESMAESKGLQAEVRILADKSAMKTSLDGNLYRNTVNVYPTGTNLEIQVTTHKKGYLYVLDGDQSRGLYLRFPLENDKAMMPDETQVTKVSLTHDKRDITVDELPGEDGLNHIIVLYSRKKIENMPELVQQMNAIEDDLDAIQRTYKIVGPEMIPTQYLEYQPGAKVNGVAIDQHIAPIIVEYKQKK